MSRREALAMPLVTSSLGNEPDRAPVLVEPGPPTLVLFGVAVSPDGRFVAFGFGRQSVPGGRAAWIGVGFLDRVTGALRRVPNPPGRHLTLTGFSPDGAQLVCLSAVAGRDFARGVALVEVATGRAIEVFGPASPFPGLPVFDLAGAAMQPGSGRLLIARTPDDASRYGLVLFDPAHRELRAVLPEATGTFQMSNLRFVSAEEVVLQARPGSRQTPLREEVVRHGIYQNELVTCRLRLGDTPRLLVPELERGTPNAPGGFLALALARDGTLFSTSRRGLPGPGFSSQVCRVDVAAQRIEYLTTTDGVKGGVGCSADGTFLAFTGTLTVDPRSLVDLWFLDRRGGAVSRLGLLARLIPDRAFWLP